MSGQLLGQGRLGVRYYEYDRNRAGAIVERIIGREFAGFVVWAWLVRLARTGRPDSPLR